MKFISTEDMVKIFQSYKGKKSWTFKEMEQIFNNFGEEWYVTNGTFQKSKDPIHNINDILEEGWEYK